RGDSAGRRRRGPSGAGGAGRSIPGAGATTPAGHGIHVFIGKNVGAWPLPPLLTNSLVFRAHIDDTALVFGCLWMCRQRSTTPETPLAFFVGLPPHHNRSVGHRDRTRLRR